MKYIKYSFLAAILLALNVNLFGQEPCTELKVKMEKTKETIINPEITILGVGLQCPMSIVKETNDPVVSVSWNLPLAVTTCALGSNITIVQTEGLPSGSNFNQGFHEVVYVATDECGDVAVCSFTVTVRKAQYYPTVVFVHGLNGDDNSWEKAASFTSSNYDCQTSRVTYKQESGLNTAGESLNTNISDNVSTVMTKASNIYTDPMTGSEIPYSPSTNTPANRNSNFVIAHSQGGIVSQFAEMVLRKDPTQKWFDYQNPESISQNYYGGLVTFGSSHQGAAILNSLVEDKDGNRVYNVDVSTDNDTLTRFVTFSNHAGKELSAGAISSLHISYLFNADQKVEDFARRLANLFTEKLIPQLVVAGNINPSSLGYMENPVFSEQSIDEINDYYGSPTFNPIPKVAFYSEINDEEEQGELVWRTAFWSSNSPNDFPESGPVFAGASMEPFKDGQERANTMKMRYYLTAQEHLESSYHYAAMAAAAVLPWNKITFHNHMKAELKTYQAYMKGYSWFESANDQYKTLIGAKTFTQMEPCNCDCIETDYDDYGNGIPVEIVNHFTVVLDDCSDDCSDYEDPHGHIECTKVFSSEQVVKLSDGVVLAESAMNMAGATINENSAGFTKDDFVLYGNIHQQMRNSKELKEKLQGVKDDVGNIVKEGLYDGYYGDHFKLK